MPISITANTVCKFSPCSQSNMDYAVWTIFVFGTKITILCLSSSQSTTCISPCISHLYMTVYLIIVSIRTWWSTVNIFKCVYIDIWTVLGEQRAACWSLLHISSLFTVFKISACSSHYFDPARALLDFERNVNMTLRTAGREPPSSGSAFSQRHSFSGEQCWASTEAAEWSKRRTLLQEELFMQASSLHLAAFRTGFKLNAPASDQSYSCVGHFESSLTIWTAIVLLQWMYCMFVCRFFFTNSAWGPLVWIKFYFS